MHDGDDDDDDDDDCHPLELACHGGGVFLILGLERKVQQDEVSISTMTRLQD